MERITSVNPPEYAPFYETYVSRVPKGEISLAGSTRPTLAEAQRDALQIGFQ